ncbi:spore germination protein KC [Paenibacillus jamilae]|jgi:spore germination protein KC|uniref:Ger(x)C family spore germination protein n=1 Tax=Paenibacillus TaxID=44249 RepID=UPI000D303BA7|nr:MULTISPECIES: Ger(x)C family spore germination protein [Paenibacillus]MDP9679052.1 spore germination protein KC [Paenibacillus jamilae]KAF6614849.1 Ger(x)C family spore germination protein [Paenibacillus sp. EKM101P]KAF6618044.1 Ger(x)C family spore germination protein [Paenibacillus sp. EKM102P]KAF6626235.1 Ger(x)C family spore germination protein [Paenibacillus sp. EKM10P]KAF6642691.1 Ger(x)C family spore germination protein [Paenibacillus sp. EKM11P]
MVRQLRVSYVLFIAGLLLTGCVDRTELNELAITTATGIDGHKGDWINTYQIIIPSAMTTGSGGSSTGASQSAVHTFSTHGKTLRETVMKSSLEYPRKLYFAQNNILVIGKKTAEQGIEEIIDIYLRNLDSRETVKVFIANGEARDFLRKLVPPEKIPGQALEKIIERDSKLGSIYPAISMYEFISKISSDSAAGVPEISLVGSEPEKLDSVDVFKETSAKNKLKLSGLSIFQKDKRVGFLNEKESMGVSWLNNQIKNTTVNYVDGNVMSAFLIRKAKVKVTPIKNLNHYYLNVDVKATGDLLSASSQREMKDMQSIHQLQMQAAEIIKLQIQEGWKALQQKNIDLIGVGNKIHHKYPKDWKKIKETWPEEFANMDIKIGVKMKLARPGLFEKSFNELLKNE